MNTVFQMRPGLFARGLCNLAKFVSSRQKNGFSMVEIGSYAGESTAIFAQYAKKIYAVDPWHKGYDSNDIVSGSNMTLVEEKFDKRMQEYANVKKLKMTSKEAVHLFEDQSLDFVYIDGEHTYDAVKFDIESWSPKLKLDGIIAGHDYCSSWKNVKCAVRKMIGKPDLVFEDSSWVKLGKNSRKLSLIEYIQYKIPGMVLGLGIVHRVGIRK